MRGHLERTGMVQRDMDEKMHSGRSNLRTALVLASIAAVFFAGVIVNRWLLGGS